MDAKNRFKFKYTEAREPISRFSSFIYTFIQKVKKISFENRREINFFHVLFCHCWNRSEESLAFNAVKSRLGRINASGEKERVE